MPKGCMTDITRPLHSKCRLEETDAASTRDPDDPSPASLSYFVKYFSNSCLERSAPSSVSTTDLAFVAGSEI